MDTPAPAYNRTLAFTASILGAVLFSAAFWATSDGGPMPVNWPDWMSSPVQFTVLFALPLGLVLSSMGRLKPMGLVYLLLAMTAVHWWAMSAAIEVATANDYGRFGGVLGGLAGGALGAVGSWVMLMLMGSGFRSAKAVPIMLTATIGLAIIGAYGVGIGSFANLVAFIGGREFASPDLNPPSLIVTLYLPWQIAYGAALASLFEHHRAR
jgi:hypothetical protein